MPQCPECGSSTDVIALPVGFACEFPECKGEVFYGQPKTITIDDTMTEEPNEVTTSREQLLALHDETTKLARSIMEAKNSDYTGGEHAEDALANFKASLSLGVHPIIGLLLRTQDKLQRLRSFVADGKLRVTGEGPEDACNDIVNYAILCKALIREEQARMQ